MYRHRPHLIAWLNAVICVLCITAVVVLEWLRGAYSFADDPIGTIVTFILIMVFLLFPFMGAVIVGRHPTNVIGWIFCLAGLSFALSNLAGAYTAYALVHPGTLPGRHLTAWIDSWVSIPGTSLTLTLLLLLFPTGRPLTRRWQWVIWLTLVSVVALMAQYAFQPGAFEDYPTIQNPLGLARSASMQTALEVIGSGGLLLSALLSIAGLITRFRRSHGVERQQMKWFAFAATLLIIVFLEAILAMAYLGQTMDATQVFVALAWLAMTLATGLAILRYRLYDIDVIINRTIVYGFLTISLGLIYGVSVISLQALLRPLAPDSQLAIVGSTIAVAGLFHPARTHVQNAVDRRFYRSKYDGTRTIETFSARLRQDVDLKSLSSELIDVVRNTMEPSHMSLWLRHSNPTAGKSEPQTIGD